MYYYPRPGVPPEGGISTISPIYLLGVSFRVSFRVSLGFLYSFFRVSFRVSLGFLWGFFGVSSGLGFRDDDADDVADDVVVVDDDDDDHDQHIHQMTTGNLVLLRDIAQRSLCPVVHKKK